MPAVGAHAADGTAAEFAAGDFAAFVVGFVSVGKVVLMADLIEVFFDQILFYQTVPVVFFAVAAVSEI